MSLILYINGQRLDLEPGQVIAQTRQVNDINSLDNRQCSYTNKFKVPKTAANVTAMDFLSYPGSNSSVPYIKNECSLYSESGECFVYKGWAIVTDGGDAYEVVVYDGVIDLYKQLENKSLADLGLEDIAHEKNVATVVSSWANELNYRYILADYNGKTGNTANGEVNIDYLVPSVRVSYLWHKIFENHNCTYSGSVFLTEAFQNLWMTYPKGINSASGQQLIFKSGNYAFLPAVQPDIVPPEDFTPQPNKYYAKFVSHDEYALASDVNGIHLKVPETGYYRLEITGAVRTTSYRRSILPGNSNTILLTSSHATIALSKNAEQYNPLQAPAEMVLYNNYQSRSAISKNLILQLEAQDSLCLTIGPNYYSSRDHFYIDPGMSDIEVKLSKIINTSVDFGAALTDFSAKDFVNEVVHRFGLTMFKDKYSSHYRFLTLQEQLNGAEIIDWSGKFNKKISENYVYGSYARRNWMRYNYNDKESDYSDYYIDINNQNLPETKDVIKSKIYSPEKYSATFLNRPVRVYKLWDKEIVEDPGENEEPVEYKPLDKRYYFLRCQPIVANVVLSSPELQELFALNGYYAESFWNLHFKDIIKSYYAPFQQIVNRSLVVNAELYISEADAAGFDFSKLYYFKQLGGHYIINKINNYIPGKNTKCELIRVAFDDMPDTDPAITITEITAQGLSVFLHFIVANLTAESVTAEFSFDGNEWSSVLAPAISPATITMPSAGTYYFRLFHSGTATYSNVIQFEI